MPRYFFHYRSLTMRIDDLEGRELADLHDALIEAQLTARKLARAYQQTHGAAPKGSVLDLADAEGAVLYEVRFDSLDD